MPRRQVNNQHRDEERGDLPITTLHQYSMIFLNGRQSAQASADKDTDALGVLIIDDQAGILHGIMGGSHGILDEQIHLLDFFLVDEIFGIKAFDLTRYLDRHVRSIKTSDQVNA